MTIYKVLGCLLVTLVALTSAADVPTGRRPLVQSPQNVAGIIGDQATIVCEADVDSPLSRVIWYEYSSGTRQQVSDGSIILPGHPNAVNFAIVQPDRTTQYYLVVNNLVLTNGGTYECTDANAGPPNNYIGRAELIVVDPITNCTSTVPTNGIVMEGQNLTNECIVTYQGGLAPTTDWIGPDGFRFLTTTNPTTVFTGIGFTVRRDMDTRNYQLHVNFTALPAAPDGTAVNAPEYSRIDAFQQMFVYWAPVNLYAVPIQVNYEVGDNITCYADGRPNPLYQWQNLADLSIVTSQVFTVTTNMIGQNTQLRCQAQNIVQGIVFSANLFIFVNVPPLTTIPPPTTTTTPPLDAPCNNLTGWWLSSFPYAELNLIVDYSSGRVTGGLRNYTDQYTVEIAGRVRVTDNAYIGVSLIYPNNIGVISLSAECHRCSGVETIFAETLWRSITDSAFCGDGGTPAPSTAYTFQRWSGGLSPGGGM